MERGTGFQEKRDGLMKNNVLALYTHVLAPGTPEWAEGIIMLPENIKRCAHEYQPRDDCPSCPMVNV